MRDSRAGHRKRLREKFNKVGIAGFHDYELIEMLLTLGTPRKDCKEQAKQALVKFHNVRGVLEASPEELQTIHGIGPHNTFGIKLVQEVARKFLKEKMQEKPIFNNAQQVFDYLYHSMRDLKKEVFKMLLMNSQNQIIESVDLPEGTVNSSFVSPREVIETILRYHAVSVIFAHNHPSGNPQPSNNDRELTRDLVFATSVMQIKVLDHLIIGDNRFFSFASEGLIEKYERNYLNLKISGTFQEEKGEVNSSPLVWFNHSNDTDIS